MADNKSTITFSAAHIGGSPKTTIMGLLGLLIAGAQSVNFDASGHLAMTQKDWYTLILGFAFAVWCAFMQDADRTQVEVPGKPGQTESAPAHPAPDDPTLKPVTKP